MNNSNTLMPGLQVPPADRLIWRADMMRTFHVGTEAVRRWIKAGKLPKPDVSITNRTKAWKHSTLKAAGIDIV